MHRVLSSAAASAIGLAVSVAVAAPTQEVPPISERLHIDQSFSTDLSGDCRYNVVVRGDVVPAKTSAAADAVVPNLVINADLQCSDQAALLLTQTVAGTQPMTRAQLEQTIEQRAKLTSAGGRYACEYTPDFNLSDAGLNLRAVTSRCPTG